MNLLLDATPLSDVAHPVGHPIKEWVKAHLLKGNRVIISELADYEVRRELIRMNSKRSLERLDSLKRFLAYAPADTDTFLRAAELWAEARNRGRPTASPKSLDADVIIGAQAQLIGATIVTSNAKHLSQFADARDWQDIT